MKHITITTRCIATVTEEWVLEVPDDFDPDAADPSDYDDRAAMMLALLDDEGPVNAQFVSVNNVDVDDEQDRTFVSWRYDWEV